ncbi:hypothetical protein BH23GEM9_BH23GEM9_05360 [soil metagenome]
MIGSLLKMVAYSKAPRATFALAHPGKAMKLLRFRRELVNSPVPRAAALGAAVLALPLGMALGRLTGRNRNGQRD